MRIGNDKNKRFLANSIFPSFFYEALALVLAQVGAAQMQGSWGLRILAGASGLVLPQEADRLLQGGPRSR